MCQKYGVYLKEAGTAVDREYQRRRFNLLKLNVVRIYEIRRPAGVRAGADITESVEANQIKWFDGLNRMLQTTWLKKN